MTCTEILKKLKSLANPSNVAGMARFGISTKGTLGVSIPVLRKLAKAIGTDHALAFKLWKSGVHEARLLAGFIADPALLTRRDMELWVRDFDSWDTCDLVCSNLFDRTPFAYDMAFTWAARGEEFVKRAGFVLMAALAVHDKERSDADFRRFFPVMRREAADDRNFVKKAVNWALRQVGKRNRALHRAAVAEAQRIAKLDSRAARWIAADALRELRGDVVRRKLERCDGR